MSKIGGGSADYAQCTGEDCARPEWTFLPPCHQPPPTESTVFLFSNNYCCCRWMTDDDTVWCLPAHTHFQPVFHRSAGNPRLTEALPPPPAPPWLQLRATSKRAQHQRCCFIVPLVACFSFFSSTITATSNSSRTHQLGEEVGCCLN